MHHVLTRIFIVTLLLPALLLSQGLAFSVCLCSGAITAGAATRCACSSGACSSEAACCDRKGRGESDSGPSVEAAHGADCCRTIEIDELEPTVDTTSQPASCELPTAAIVGCNGPERGLSPRLEAARLRPRAPPALRRPIALRPGDLPLRI